MEHALIIEMHIARLKRIVADFCDLTRLIAPKLSIELSRVVAMAAAIAAVEFIDKCLGRLRLSVEKAGGVLLITADHGNIEQMKDPKTGEPHTAHTVFDVPIVVVGSARSKRAFALENGRLADVAPTLLELAGIAQPPEMTGRSLVRFVAQNKHAKEDARPAL